jgi:GNAT superfamily N-acetyltransferase
VEKGEGDAMTVTGHNLEVAGAIVRQATPADARVTLAVMERLLNETPFMLRKREELIDTVADEAQFLHNLRASGNSAVFLATVNCQGVGLLVAAGGALLRLRHVVYMGMGVVTSHWSRGIGGALLDAAILWLERHPVVRKLSLQVYATNERAIELYRRKGFRLEGRLRDEVLLEEGYVDMLQMAYRKRG